MSGNSSLKVWKTYDSILRMADELAQVLKMAARLAGEAADALRRGDSRAALRLQREAEDALWRARKLGQRQVPRNSPVRARSARSRTVSALTELGVPSSPKQIAEYSEACTGERFDVRALASIRRDEQRSWRSGSKREVYIVPALEGEWFLAGRGRLALSHWPLPLRLIGPLSPRADHLRSCLRIIHQIEVLGAASGAAKRLTNLLAQYARTVPSALKDVWSDNEPDLKQVERAVRAELDLIGNQDDSSRQRAAERAARQLDSEQSVWGGVMPQVVAARSG
jgi:hypothetical protein